jgi:ABC-type transport system substrate-binding protein
MAATGVAATAGCLGGGGDGEEADPGEAQEQVETDLADVKVGGRLEYAIERGGIEEYDMADSSLADDSMVFNLVYDGLRAQDTEGAFYNWMADEYETTDAQDVDWPGDYTEYMEEQEISSVTEGTPIFDLGGDDKVLAQHPDDAEALSNGDIGEGDTMRVLRWQNSGAAVDDGVYGTKIEGKLHEGIEFHNGEECTAENVVRSFERLIGSVNEGQQFTSIFHARAPNGMSGYEFELYAKQPDAIAASGVSPFYIFPSEHLDVPPGDLDPRGGGPEPIGTGPYKVEEYEEGTQLVLTKNENYWVEEVGLDSKDWWDGVEGDIEFPESPVIDEINFRFMPEESARVAALRDQTIDMSYQISPEDLTSFQQDEDLEEYRVSAATSTGFLFTQIPVNGGGDLENKEVRQAIQNMIPRQQIVDTVEDGWASPAQVPFPKPAAGLGTEFSYEEAKEQDWAYPVETQPDTASDLMDEAGVETPMDLTLESNSDDNVRTDKMELTVGEMNATDVFSAEAEQPAAIGPWTQETLYTEGATEDYGSRNAVATIGIGAGFDPHSYPWALHHPELWNGCCNFFHGPGTFDFIDHLDSCRFGPDVAQDPDLRRQRYDELWPMITDVVGNTIIDFSLETVVVGPDVGGFNAFPTRQSYLSYGLYAPYDDQLSYLERADEDLA